jgi:hypothetical protein
VESMVIEGIAVVALLAWTALVASRIQPPADQSQQTAQPAHHAHR